MSHISEENISQRHVVTTSKFVQIRKLNFYNIQSTEMNSRWVKGIIKKIKLYIKIISKQISQQRREEHFNVWHQHKKYQKDW